MNGGDAEAMRYVGQFHQHGGIVPQDLAEAERRFARAEAAGYEGR